MTGPVILPVDVGGDRRTASIVGLTAQGISARLGFAPNVVDDRSKAPYSWGFTVDGVRCGVWGSGGTMRVFSAWGPVEALRRVFGEHVA